MNGQLPTSPPVWRQSDYIDVRSGQLVTVPHVEPVRPVKASLPPTENPSQLPAEMVVVAGFLVFVMIVLGVLVVLQ